tara:strand:+ start:473 stop:691 length:219 start_codon:yes stop_codon:yes gene_type:complete
MTGSLDVVVVSIGELTFRNKQSSLILVPSGDLSGSMQRLPNLVPSMSPNLPIGTGGCHLNGPIGGFAYGIAW